MPKWTTDSELGKFTMLLMYFKICNYYSRKCLEKTQKITDVYISKANLEVVTKCHMAEINTKLLMKVATKSL
jgi:hypothetical protein